MSDTEEPSITDLLELDLPTRADSPRSPFREWHRPCSPRAPTVCNCRAFTPPSEALPLAIRGVCPRCSRPRTKLVQVATPPAIDAPAAPAGFGEIQAEAAHNAATVSPGSMAGGELASVGFTSALGYIQALRNGVTQRTYESYITTLRARFGYTSASIADLGLPGPQLGVRTPNQQQAATQTSDRALTRGNIVAGAAAEGQGVLIGFGGLGTMNRATLLATVAAAGMPESWAPAPLSAHAHAGQVMQALNGTGLIARSQRRDGGAYAARWHAVAADATASVGSAYGTAVLIATLTDGGELIVESTREELAARVRSEYAARVAAELYSAVHISQWLKETLVSRFRAAKLGGNWYIRREHAAAAEAMLVAFSKVWGRDYLLPALPVASSDQLRKGIVDSFGREVGDALHEYHQERDETKANGKRITVKRAHVHHAKIRELAERCVGYAALLGEVYTRELRARLVDASEEIGESMDGIAIRFGLIFDELAADAAKAGTVVES